MGSRSWRRARRRRPLPARSPGRCLVAGAGEVVEPIPAPGRHGVVLIPQAEGPLDRRRSTPRPTGSARRAAPPSSRRFGPSCARRRPVAPRRSPTPTCSSTTCSRRRCRFARRSARRWRRSRAPARLGPWSPAQVRPPFGLFADAAAAEAAAESLRGGGFPAAIATRAGVRREDAPGSAATGLTLLIVGVLAIGLLLFHNQLPSFNVQKVLAGASRARSAPGPTCWSAASPSSRPAPSSAWSRPARR